MTSMRRLRNRPPGILFRGAELPRLMTLFVMLGVLVLLIDLAREPQTWRWLVPHVDKVEQAAAGVAGPGNRGDQVMAPEPGMAGPTDEDPQEQDAAREEFQAVSDKAPLRDEEMPAYWRLMAWEEHQSTKELLARARKNVTFNELYRRPETWRGKLLQFPVHVQQSAVAEDLADNPLGLESVQEVWGWNSDSQPYWYWLIVPRLPPNMPSGKDIYEEATFVGYFLKLLPYEDHRGKTLATPLLIGRLIWHPAPDNPLMRRDEWTWPWYLAGGLAVLFILRWTLTVAARRSAGGWSGSSVGGDPRSVEDWLDGAKDLVDDTDWEERETQAGAREPPPWEITGPPSRNE
jgi:hypothetical protein